MPQRQSIINHQEDISSTVLQTSRSSAQYLHTTAPETSSDYIMEFAELLENKMERNALLMQYVRSEGMRERIRHAIALCLQSGDASELNTLRDVFITYSEGKWRETIARLSQSK